MSNKQTIFFLFFFIFLFVFDKSAFSQNSGEVDSRFEDISGQYAECAAYYRLAYYALKNSNDEESAKVYSELDDRSMFYSLLLANEGRDQDMAVEVTHSRIEVNLKKMKKEIGNRNENFSILINNYHFKCENLLENPPDEVMEVLEEKVEELHED